MEDVVKKVSKMSNIPPKEIIGKSRKMEIVEARHASIYFVKREIIGASLSSIGIYFGERSHYYYAFNKSVSSKIKRDIKVNNSIVNLKEQIEELL